MKKQFISKHTTFATAVLLCSGMLLIQSNARAQPPPMPCNCISISHSNIILCDTCWDSIVYHGIPPHEIPDTTVICDTCYTFALTNNCSYGISAIQIFDSVSGGGIKQLKHGCAMVQYGLEDSNWVMTNDSDGSAMFQDTGSLCWEQGATILISVCNPLKQGNTISMVWWSCALPPKLSPFPLCDGGETVIVP
jgi:hypothetical protein